MKQFYFCRHGSSKANEAGLYAGQSETPLTMRGRQQAVMAGKYARDNLQVDHIISSPYSRAYDTAKIIADQIGYDESNIAISSLFIERHLGILEGQPYLPNVSDFALDLIAEVETSQALEDRVRQAYNYVESLPYDNILVVSHGATGRMLRHVLNPEVPFWSDDPVVHEANRFANAQIVRLIA